MIDIINEIPKIAFLFIGFIIVSSKYVSQVLSCQTQHFFKTHLMARHIIGVFICFLFIIMIGGWSFDMEMQNKAKVDYTNGNAIDSFIFGFFLYILFLASSKMELSIISILCHDNYQS